MKYLTAIILLFISCYTSKADSQALDEEYKRSVYEIIIPGNGMGTGFAIKHKELGTLGTFLITCRHVVQDSMGNYVDSIFIRKNILLQTKQVIADTEKIKIYLKKDEYVYFREHPNKNIDLVMIFLLNGWNMSLNEGEYFHYFYTDFLIDADKYEELAINEGSEIEIVGFSLSQALHPNESHFHYSKFGKIGLFTSEEFSLKIDQKIRPANFLLLDMIIRKGDSGAPIIAHIGNSKYLIGFVSGYSPSLEYGIGFPTHYIYDFISLLKESYERFKNQE